MTNEINDRVEASMVLTLSAGETVPRSVLEDLTVHVEEVLGEHVADIAPGASASANFPTSSIEIDLVLEGETPADVHQLLAVVIARLERHCGMNIRTGSALSHPLSLTSTASQVSAAPAALVPA
jgi:hypothetical protein